MNDSERSRSVRTRPRHGGPSADEGRRGRDRQQTALAEVPLSSSQVRALQKQLQRQQAELELQAAQLLEVRRALAVSEARYGELHDLSPVGYLTLDASGAIRDANPVAALQLGEDRRTLLGRWFESWLGESTRATWHALRGAALA